MNIRILDVACVELEDAIKYYNNGKNHQMTSTSG
jgi:hypothetical protein